MTQSIVKHEGNGAALAPGEWQAMREQAKALVSSKFLPKAVDTPEKAIAVMMTGRELGIGPMQALRCVHIIDGKPTLAAELIAALVLRRVPGSVLEVAESTNERCVVIAARPGRPERPFTFTIEDAKAAGITGKDNWKKYPRAMLRSRAITEAARAVFPDATLGVYDPDELGAVTNEKGEIVATITPVETPPKITTYADSDEDPDTRGDEALLAEYMETMRVLEERIDNCSEWEECERIRERLGSKTKPVELTQSFRKHRESRRLGPLDQKDFAKAWARCDRKLTKKEAELDPGSAAEFVDAETGEVSR